MLLRMRAPLGLIALLTALLSFSTTLVSSCAVSVCHPARLYFYSNLFPVRGVTTSTSVYNLYSIKPNGTQRTQLTQSTVTSSSWPSPSPNGAWVAYYSTLPPDATDWDATANPSRNLYKMRWDGSDRTVLTRNTSTGLDSAMPVWTPDSTKIIFESKQDLTGALNGTTTTSYNFWIMNSDGTGATPLTRWSGANYNPAFPWPAAVSPDGTKIAFSAKLSLTGDYTQSAAAAWNLFIMNIDGTGLTALTRSTTSGVTNSEPVFTPDGNWIIYDSTQNPNNFSTWDGTAVNYNIHRIKPDGTQVSALTQHTTIGVSAYASVSNDSQWIVFQSTRNLDGTTTSAANSVGNWWKMKIDGTQVTSLTQMTTGGVSNFVVFDTDGIGILAPTFQALDGSTGGTSAGLNLWRLALDGSASPQRLTDAPNSTYGYYFHRDAFFSSKRCD